jgi:hypothetical protein
MYRAGLILAGLVGGMVTFGGSALAVSPTVTAESTYTAILPGHGHDDEKKKIDFGEWNNFGKDDDVIDLDLLNELLSEVLSA